MELFKSISRTIPKHLKPRFSAYESSMITSSTLGNLKLTFLNFTPTLHFEKRCSKGWNTEVAKGVDEVTNMLNRVQETFDRHKVNL